MVIGDELPAGIERARTYLEPFYALALLTPAAAPPPDLVSRVAAEHEKAPDPAEGAGDNQARRPGRMMTLLRAAAPAPIVALVLLGIVLVGSLVLNVVMLSGHDFRPIDVAYGTGTPAAGDARGVVLTDGDRLILFATGLAELTSGYHYVVWSGGNDNYRRLGRLVEIGDGNARLVIDDPVFPDFVEITIEDTPRPDVPEGPAVLIVSGPVR
jgi:hypothetical protein